MSKLITPDTPTSNILVNQAYQAKERIDEKDFSPFDPLANGGSNVVGRHNMRVRIDMQRGNITAGIFQQEPGALDIHWQYTEHAFVIQGEVRITDLVSGTSTTYGPGDGWTIEQGSRTHWEVLSSFSKSFFTVTE